MKAAQNLKPLSSALLFLALCLNTEAGSITNNFTTTYDYAANGVIGDTNWDGVYLGLGDVPGGNPGGDGNGTSIVANANSFSGFLTV